MKRGLALVVAVATAVSVTALVTPAGAQSGKVPGVTAKEIRVGAVVGKTNPTGAPYEDVATGAEMYFDTVNKKGGIYGKKYKMVAVLDDQTRDSKNLVNTRSLVEEKDVFAVIMATQTFAGATYLVEKGVPTFGWNIQDEWSRGPNLFGDKGSWLCFGSGCYSMAPAYAAQQEGVKAAGTLGYGSSPQSADCSKSQETTFNRWGPPMVLADRSLSFGFSANDISAAVKEIKDRNVGFIAPCMDLNGAVNFNKALKQAGVTNVKWYAPEGYREEVLEDLGPELENFIFVVSFLPFDQAQYSPGMKKFLAEVKKRKLQPSEHLLVGWQNAMLLNEGIKLSGKDFTQKSVVDEINGLTSWTAEGTRAPIDWTSGHTPTGPNELSCSAYVQVKNGKFQTVYGKPGKPFVCHRQNPWPASLSDVTYLAPGEAAT